VNHNVGNVIQRRWLAVDNDQAGTAFPGDRRKTRGGMNDQRRSHCKKQVGIAAPADCGLEMSSSSVLPFGISLPFSSTVAYSRKEEARFPEFM